jgi:hypothetical protein
MIDRRRMKHGVVQKFDCGCRIRKGGWEGAFEIFPCDYHKGNLNTTSCSLSEIEKQIQRDLR